MKAIICNHCNRVFPEDGRYHALSEKRLDHMYPTYVIHLCDECFEKLKEWADADKRMVE